MQSEQRLVVDATGVAGNRRSFCMEAQRRFAKACETPVDCRRRIVRTSSRNQVAGVDRSGSGKSPTPVRGRPVRRWLVLQLQQQPLGGITEELRSGAIST